MAQKNAQKPKPGISAAAQEAIDRALGNPTPCTHWARHTVYGSEDWTRNGTWCQVCGKRLDGPQGREVEGD